MSTVHIVPADLHPPTGQGMPVLFIRPGQDQQAAGLLKVTR